MCDSVQHMATLIDTPEVRVAEYAIKPGSGGDRHYHSSVREFCVCLEGCLLIERDGAPAVLLAAGQRAEMEAGVVHRVSNPESTPSRYMVVQGTGPYDFIAVQAAP
jgi:quercetin dioxygenase-like cupin family protein